MFFYSFGLSLFTEDVLIQTGHAYIRRFIMKQEVLAHKANVTFLNAQGTLMRLRRSMLCYAGNQCTMPAAHSAEEPTLTARR